MTDDRQLAWMKSVFPHMFNNNFDRSTPFWRELYQKKFGLFGQWGATAVPEKLVRHPWSLRAAEFKSALDAIVVDGSVPSISDDRTHVSAVAGGTGAVLALAGLANPIAGIPGAVIGAVAGGIALRGEIQSHLEQGRIQSHIGEFAEIYKREAAYRSVEVPTQVVSAMP